MKFTNRRIAHAVLAKKNELKKNELRKKHKIHNSVYLNESMCPQIKHLFFLCRKLKLAGKIAYYSFFNGALKIKRTEDGQKKNIAHISDISRVTNLSKVEIEKIAGIEQSDWLVPPTVINVKDSSQVTHDIFIGRPSIWGNIYKLSEFPRDICIEHYERYARGSYNIISNLSLLSARQLVCFCKPLPCHGDVLVKLCKEHF